MVCRSMVVYLQSKYGRHENRFILHGVISWSKLYRDQSVTAAQNGFYITVDILLVFLLDC